MSIFIGIPQKTPSQFVTLFNEPLVRWEGSEVVHGDGGDHCID
jgi:hypothetical protein